MSSGTVRTLVQAFISCGLDYSKLLFYGITDGLINRLQFARNQNAAARLASGARCYDHIMPPVVEELHWLPVRRWVDFKMVYLTVRHGFSLPVRQLSARLRRKLSSASF